MPRSLPSPARGFRLDFAPLRARRLELGVSQADLAKAIGVHRRTLIRTEQNRTAPTAAQVVALARALGTPVYLLYEVMDTAPRDRAG